VDEAGLKGRIKQFALRIMWLVEANELTAIFVSSTKINQKSAITNQK